SISGEVYGGTASRYGMRAFGLAPTLALGAGLDFDIKTGRTDLALRYQTAVRRGGLLGYGTMLRADWLPAADRLGLGISVPIAQPFAGRVRPKHTSVSLPMASASDDR